MQHGTRIGLHHHRLLQRLKSSQRHRDVVIAHGYRAEFEFAAIVRILRLHPIRILRLQRDVRTLDRPVLRIVYQASNAAKNSGVRQRAYKQKTARNQKYLEPSHMPSRFCGKPAVSHYNGDASKTISRSSFVWTKSELCERSSGRGKHNAAVGIHRRLEKAKTGASDTTRSAKKMLGATPTKESAAVYRGATSGQDCTDPFGCPAAVSHSTCSLISRCSGHIGPLQQAGWAAAETSAISPGKYISARASTATTAISLRAMGQLYRP